jgi:copper chaperone CopZ
MKIEVLFFEGCPNHRPAVELVNQLLKHEGIQADITEVNVADEAAAKEAGFLGSPSIRVNGLDVEPAARSSRDYGMACRTYVNEGRREGLPARALVRAALWEALGKPAPQERLDHSKRSAWLTGTSVAAAAAASLCCILPIVFALTGMSVLGAAAALAEWRPYLLAVTFGLLAFGFYFAYRPVKAQCAPGSACAMNPSRRSSRIALWTATAAVVALAAFPYYSGNVANILIPSQAAQAASGGETGIALRSAAFLIEGMDCAACAAAIQNKLRAVAGVREARVGFESKKAEVRYDPGLTTVEQLQQAIENAGYRSRKS